MVHIHMTLVHSKSTYTPGTGPFIPGTSLGRHVPRHVYGHACMCIDMYVVYLHMTLVVSMFYAYMALDHFSMAEALVDMRAMSLDMYKSFHQPVRVEPPELWRPAVQPADWREQRPRLPAQSTCHSATAPPEALPSVSASGSSPSPLGAPTPALDMRLGMRWVCTRPTLGHVLGHVLGHALGHAICMR